MICKYGGLWQPISLPLPLKEFRMTNIRNDTNWRQQLYKDLTSLEKDSPWKKILLNTVKLGDKELFVHPKIVP